MERNPGAWRKMAGLLILLALCILPCGAETSNRQRIIALDSEVYQDIDAAERDIAAGKGVRIDSKEALDALFV